MSSVETLKFPTQKLQTMKNTFSALTSAGTGLVSAEKSWVEVYGMGENFRASRLGIAGNVG